MRDGPTVLLVDLNNFALYPTISIGYLASILRRAGAEVSVFSPLSAGVPGVVREPRVPPWGLADQKMRYWSATTKNPLVRSLRQLARDRFATPKMVRDSDKIVDKFRQLIAQDKFDAVLVSSYLIHFDTCQQIAQTCKTRSIPLLIGGPYFAQPEVRKEWTGISGLTALVGGEIELRLPEVIDRATTNQSLADIPGIWEAGTWNGGEAAPLPKLDLLPYPDYNDFPWGRYHEPMIPMITGRGCGWSACTFCSDVTSTAGRRYRSRSIKNVFDEIAFQHEKHNADLFVFTDLKLNSNPSVWGALIENFRLTVPNGRWVGSVHVDRGAEESLSFTHLKSAADSGMVRVTTGLESGSQRILDAMKKGVDLEMMSSFLQDAAAAGISARVTLIVGYPGEEPEDICQTADFLRQHRNVIERVLVNRFQVMSGTRFHRSLSRHPRRFPAVEDVSANHQIAQIDHHLKTMASNSYRRQIGAVLREAHEINRLPLRGKARAFEGVM